MCMSTPLRASVFIFQVVRALVSTPEASVLLRTCLPICPQPLEQIGNPQDTSWVGWGSRFPERKDAGGGGKSQLSGAATPPTLYQRLARCVFSLPGSWDSCCHIGHLLCGFRVALRPCPNTTAVAVAPRTNLTPLWGLQSGQSFYMRHFHTSPPSGHFPLYFMQQDGRGDDKAKGRVGRNNGEG